MMNFKIDPEFSSYLPRQTAEERQTLSEKITEEGCAPGALVVGEVRGEMILLDGHTTLEICSELKVEPADPRVIRFRNRDDAKRWMRRHQLARRNLTDEQRTYYLGEEFNSLKNPRGGQVTPKVQNEPSVGSTAEKVAEQHGVSASTVKRAGAFAEAVNSAGEESPKAREAILSGNSGLTKQEVMEGKKPVLCSRCQRVGATDDCPACAELRKGKPKAEGSVKGSVKGSGPSAANGRPKKVKTPKESADKALGQLVRALDKMGLYPKHKPALDALRQDVKSWRKSA